MAFEPRWPFPPRPSSGGRGQPSCRTPQARARPLLPSARQEGVLALEEPDVGVPAPPGCLWRGGRVLGKHSARSWTPSVARLWLSLPHSLEGWLPARRDKLRCLVPPTAQPPECGQAERSSPLSSPPAPEPWLRRCLRGDMGLIKEIAGFIPEELAQWQQTWRKSGLEALSKPMTVGRVIGRVVIQPQAPAR